MAVFDNVIRDLQELESYSERTRLAELLLRTFGSTREKITTHDRDALILFAMAEIEDLSEGLCEAESYREKDTLLTYAEVLLQLVILCYGTPGQVADGHMAVIGAMGETIRREQFVERAISETFEQGVPDAADLDRLLCVVSPLQDEYRKGKLYEGLLHFGKKVSRLGADAKEVLARYTAAELNRYLAMDALDEDALGCLEYLADACRYFMNDDLADGLTRLLSRVDGAPRYYAAASLLETNRPVADTVIDSLAHDRAYAILIHDALCAVGKEERFPEALRNEAYLAESDMIHWLLYPTELGQYPDEIEYLGRIKKRGVYHIFRFKSSSKTLGSDRVDRWLIGWSGQRGNTFSNFDLYDDYVKETPEKTLKHIKRKLL